MRAALLLIDLQHDFLQRPGLHPPADSCVERAAHLLRSCRALSLPVAHAHTVVREDGRDRMPHWKNENRWECVEGTAGCSPPPSLAPLGNEPVFRKRYYSAFESGELRSFLEGRAVDHLIVAGLYLHGCVRATVLDAYASGLEVWVAVDATASPDCLHSQVTREYLSERAARFLDTEAILDELQGCDRTPVKVESRQPVGWIGGEPVPQRDHVLAEQRNPADWQEVIAQVPLAQPEDVAAAVAVGMAAQRSWSGVSADERARVLLAWADRMEDRQVELARSVTREVAKPRILAQEEIRFAVRLVRATVEEMSGNRPEPTTDGRMPVARRRALGQVGVVTPWNNPVAIPVGKIAAAVAFGNAVIWKAAVQAPASARSLVETLIEAGVPPGLVSVLFGGPVTVGAMLSRSEIAAVSFTGSCDAGREVAALCGRRGKLLQAELGGNNGAVVLPDADLDSVAHQLAVAAFGFAGQRCTATRRFIVHRRVREPFREALVGAIGSLAVGDPQDPETLVGPVISRRKQEELGRMVETGGAIGAAVLCGGEIPAEWTRGCWFEPTLFETADASSPLVQEETFGPVAVLQVAEDLDEALHLLNAVPQGLVASLYSHEREAQERFLEEAACGILKLNEPTVGVHPRAPFSGWKASGLGPPEHGPGDAEAYTRWQAIYP